MLGFTRLRTALGVLVLALSTAAAGATGTTAAASAVSSGTTASLGTGSTLGTTSAFAPPPTSAFEKVELDGGLSMGEPIELSVLPDGKVLYINRGTTSGGGQVRLYNPTTKATTVALTVQLDARFEDGLIGITLHPQFATNRWVYLFYSPKVTPLVNRISRFTFNTGTNVLDPASEDMIIEWPTERELCCHSAGSMTWDSNNNLYFAVGDNTNSGGDSAGMAPIDERTSRNPQYDAQRTSGNTNDLRGKINRIHPENNGTYTIPAGNLFAPGTARDRPEIYVDGHPQPVPDLGRQEVRATPCTGARSAPTPRDPRQPRPRRLRRVQPRHRPRQLRLALLRAVPINVAYNDWDFAAKPPAAGSPAAARPAR